MKVSKCFPSKYLKAADLRGQYITVVISHFDVADFGSDGKKPVLFFEGKTKGLCLNKTNAFALANEYGDDMEDWPGNEVILFQTMVDYKGSTVPSIRIRFPQAKDGRGNSRDTDGDDSSPPRTRKPAMAGAGARGDLEDEIPF